MHEIEAADAGGRRHRRVLGQFDPESRRVQQIEQFELLAVIGARRIAKSGSNAAVALGEDVIGGETFLEAPFLA